MSNATSTGGEESSDRRGRWLQYVRHGMLGVSVVLVIALGLIWVRNLTARDVWVVGAGGRTTRTAISERGYVELNTARVETVQVPANGIASHGSGETVFPGIRVSQRYLPVSPSPESPGREFLSEKSMQVQYWLITFLAGLPAMWWLVTRRAVLQTFRQRRGLCAHCGYDVRASKDVCPECGRSIRRT